MIEDKIGRTLYLRNEPAQLEPGRVHSYSFSTQFEKFETQISQVIKEHWKPLHTVVRTPAQLEEWEEGIPNYDCGGTCKRGYLEIKDRNPPRFKDGQLEFEWTVEVHEKLSKPILSIDEARSVWLPEYRFFTLSDLNSATIDLARKLPAIRGVAGVPVSGMLVAPTLSTLLHVPLYEASVEFGLRKTAHGHRGFSRQVDETLPLLIVDDTVSSGNSFDRVRERLQSELNLIYAAALVNPPALAKVDFYGQLCPEPHLLEWNLANTGYVRSLGYPDRNQGSGLMIDFDGVLCPDGPPGFDETTSAGRSVFLDWLANAPLGSFVPRMYAIPEIVSYRCEYTRAVSEEWLARNGIKFDQLRLWGNPSDSPEVQVATRTWRACDWKGKLYSQSASGLFVESCALQAEDIGKVSRKPVLCWDTKHMTESTK
jgi:hypothetical protein